MSTCGTAMAGASKRRRSCLASSRRWEGWTLDKVFDLYVAGKDQYTCSAVLTLPASIYEMVDAVERVTSKTMDKLEYH